MIRKRLILSSILFFFAIQVDAQTKTLFNGKNLDGWQAQWRTYFSKWAG